jgi:hypothetical protein
MRRSYLAGRVGHGFPEHTPALLGQLNGTAYLHEIRTPDAGRAHHSHPWEWAISMVLVGGYTEEVVGADGSVTTRRREPGSVAVINVGSFHRIAQLHAPRVWTLFIVGPRTPDRAWYFRRLDGSIVHERDYDDGTVAPVRAPASPTPIDAPSSATREAVAQAATALGVPVVQHWPSSNIEKRLTFSDGSIAERLPGDDVEATGETLVYRHCWRVTVGENMAAQWVARDLAAFKKANRVEPLDAPPQGYSFERRDGPLIIIHNADSYVGSLMTDGRAVAHGREVPPEEIAPHSVAWAYARAMWGAS